MAQEALLVKESAARDGADAGRRSERPVHADGVATLASENKSYVVERDGALYAGTHLLIDLWGADNLSNLDIMEQALRDCVTACGATLLHIHLHEFTPNGGVSGVAVLAESHISVHTWPEFGFAAFDVFMCGACDPIKAVPVLERAFAPDRTEVIEQMRGRHR